ncbi:MAG: hypothetical protein ABSG68_11470 [Thermoguttaceae bacterium]|jgi:hypothetical protein
MTDEQSVRMMNWILGPLFLLFLLLYDVAPLIIVPIIAYFAGKLWLLNGILFSFGGTRPIALKLRLVPLATAGMIVFWVYDGFSVYQSATFFYFCALWGYLLFQFQRILHSVLLKRKQDLAPFLKGFLAGLDSQ